MYPELQNRLADGYVLRQRYQILELISDNTGFGITYLAKDLDLPNNHKCVVKQLKLQNSNPEIIKIATRLFKSESECLYKLGKHDQIPRLYARFEENGEFYLVQEYIEGNNLSSEIKTDKLWNEEKTIKYLKEILEILKFVHQENVIHRDIKPDNIIRREHDQKLVLIDFGAVKEINSTRINAKGQPMLTVCIGPRNYMPEEQYGGKPVLASDVYLVGATCIWGLTGTPCLEGWRNRINIEISDKLASILYKMTCNDWQERYQNAGEALSYINEMFFSSVQNPTQITLLEKLRIWWNEG